MKELILSNGYKTIVDDEDYDELNQFKWHARKTPNSVYAVRNANGTTVQLHRVITKCPKNLMVDHINRDGLDNRKENLRICTRSQNLMNSKKPKKGKTSKFKGVHRVKQRTPGHKKLWRATVRCNKKIVFVKDFLTEQEAADAYNTFALIHFRNFARINK